jgi:HD superfamily phosphohydrolase
MPVRQQQNAASSGSTPAPPAEDVATRAAPVDAAKKWTPDQGDRRRAPDTLHLQEFFIPIHGLVRLAQDELPIVDHPAFQHLGGIYQLGQTCLVYRGATHTRFEHALGTRAVVEMMIQALKRTSRTEPTPTELSGKWRLDRELSYTERRFVRLGALLHDIGHLPAGHTIEDELGRLDSHDRPHRLKLVLGRKEWNGVKVPQSLRQVINRQFKADAEASALVYENGRRTLTATEIVELLISKEPRPTKSQDRFRLGVCRDLIGNTICADLLDYLHRDWHHIGKERTFDTRLLEYLEIRTKAMEDRQDARLVINLRSGNRIRTDAVTAILDLLESRYQLAEIALFHKTKVCAAAMLERAIAELTDLYRHREGDFLSELETQLLESTDAEMLSALEALAEKGGKQGSLSESDRRALVAVPRLARALRWRHLHRQFTSKFEYELPQSAKALQDLYTGPSDVVDARERARQGATNRLSAVRLIERDFGMDAGSFVMYCPPRDMNSKIAEVQVLINGDVLSLAKFEAAEPDHGITGGHLAAQQARFRRLWRVAFAIERTASRKLAERRLLEPLGNAIDHCVLGLEPTGGSLQDDMVGLARELTRTPGTPLYRRRLLPEARIAELAAARQSPQLRYPGGALSLLEYTEPGRRAGARA